MFNNNYEYFVNSLKSRKYSFEKISVIVRKNMINIVHSYNSVSIAKTLYNITHLYFECKYLPFRVRVTKWLDIWYS